MEREGEGGEEKVEKIENEKLFEKKTVRILVSL